MGQKKRERWLPVVGYKGLYEVSNEGRVRTFHGHSREKGYVMQAALAGGGGGRSEGGQYLAVSLHHRNGRQRCCLIHRLVARAFIGPCPKGHHVDHLNANKTDNRAENLEYVTPKENYARATAAGLNYKASGEDHGNAWINEDIVAQVRGRKLAGESQRSIALDLRLSDTHVSKICRGVLWPDVRPANVKTVPKQKTKKQQRLTEAKVRRIRRLAAKGHSQTAIGDKLGIGQSHVGMILRGKIWGHVE